MKSFITKFILFTIPLPLIWAVFVLTINPIYTKSYNSPSGDEAIFVWGDSQLHRGIDFEALMELTGLTVFSSSEHGSGVYDFLVFAERVPRNAKVIVSISRTAQLRRKSRDRNMAGLSFSAMRLLLDNGYTWKDLARVVAKNPRPISIFHSENPLYKVGEDDFKNSDLDLFETIYSSKPDYTSSKQKIYLKGLEILREKECTILLVDFPYHSKLREIEQRSELKEVTDDFEKVVQLELQANYMQFDIEGLDGYMHDFTHLHELGAQLVTEEVATLIDDLKFNSYLKIQ